MTATPCPNCSAPLDLHRDAETLECSSCGGWYNEAELAEEDGAQVVRFNGSVVICGSHTAMCECVLSTGHEGAHECDPGCNGSWTYNEQGEFVVVRLPLGTGQGRVRSPAPLSVGRGAIRYIQIPEWS